MEEGEVTLESELSNWFSDYADKKLIKNAAKSIEERVINRYYIKKEDVLEAIGEDEITEDSGYAPYSMGHYINEFRDEIKEKLNIGDK